MVSGGVSVVWSCDEVVLGHFLVDLCIEVAQYDFVGGGRGLLDGVGEVIIELLSFCLWVWV